MRRVCGLIGILLFSALMYAQSTDQSLNELKDTYFEKRHSFSSSSSKKFTADQQAQLDQLVNQMKEMDENSFEYNLTAYVNGNYNTALKDHLMKAYELNNSDETVLREMLGYYILTSNSTKQKEFLLKIQKFYTSAELAYYGDALPAGKSMLVTSGQEDFYGYLLAQVVNGKGAEVQVVCLDFMKQENYRTMVSNNGGITDLNFLGNEKNYLSKLVAVGKTYLALTVPQDYFSTFSDRMYLTGLFYQYNVTNQQQRLADFWTQIKSRDLAGMSLSGSSEKKLCANYLAPLLTLYMYTPDDLVLKNTIQAFAEKVGKAKEVTEIFQEIEAN